MTLISMLAGAVVLAAVFAVWQWHRDVQERREQRLVRRNLHRGGLL